MDRSQHPPHEGPAKGTQSFKEKLMAIFIELICTEGPLVRHQIWLSRDDRDIWPGQSTY